MKISGLVSAVICFYAGWKGSIYLAEKVSNGTRIDETPRNQVMEAPSKQEILWHITHTRDDVSGIYAILTFIAGLLAAILGVLVFR